MAVVEQNVAQQMASLEPRGRLNGWKDVAGYVGKSIRTVQRWERQTAFPVHRITTPNGEVVYAFKAEIDEWAAERDTRSEPLLAATSSVAAEPPPTPRRLSRRLTVAGALVAGSLLTLLAGFLVVEVVPLVVRTVRRARFVDQTEVGPASWRVEDDRLEVFNANDDELWQYKFGFDLEARAYSKDDSRRPSPVTLVDLEGDGGREVLFIAHGREPNQSALYCFDARGSLRFVTAPHSRVRFGEVDYGPPFEVQQLLLTDEPNGRHSIWLVAAHHAWFPTVIQKMSHTGDVVAEYWNNGAINLVREARIGATRVLLAGGNSEEQRGPSLTVLDYAAPSGSAPADDQRYRCSGCTAKPPLASIVIPFTSLWSEMNIFPRVDDTLVSSNGFVTLALHGTRAVAADGDSRSRWDVVCTFDQHYYVVDVQFTNPYAAEASSLLPSRAGQGGREARLQMFPVLRWIDGRRM